MDKKELKIIKLLDKASGYAGKIQGCLDDALEVALSDKGLTKRKSLFWRFRMRQVKKKL